MGLEKPEAWAESGGGFDQIVDTTHGGGREGHKASHGKGTSGSSMKGGCKARNNAN